MNQPSTLDLDFHFKLANIFAMSGWIVLIFLPFWEAGPKFILYGSFILLACLYAFLLKSALTQNKEATTEIKDSTSGEKPGFTTLTGVLTLLKDPVSALTAWVHILAFDLMIGFYIAQQGALLNISHWLLIPCYLLTLMLGPLGLLLFLLISMPV